jgi:hypothetical protein
MMRLLLQLISYVALLGSIVPSLLYLKGGMDLPTVKVWMLVSTVVWFAVVPCWMDRRQSG